MSDEKLSEGLERELQEVAVEATKFGFAPATYAGHASKIADNMRPLLARLERERDAARSETLEEAAKHYPISMHTPNGYRIECECGWHSVCIRNDDGEDLMKLWQGHVRLLTPSVVSQPSREREVPLDPMLPLSLTDVREATDMYVECDGKLKRDYRGLAVVLNARVKAWFLERSTATPASTGEQS